MNARAEMDLDCTDEEWSEFIKRVEAIGEKEIEQMIARQKEGKPEPTPTPVDGSMLYYWHHLMGGGDDS